MRRRIILMISSVLLLTACGFHLRGSKGDAVLAFKTLSFVGATDNTLAQNLNAIFRRQVILVPPPNPAEVIVELSEVRHSKVISTKDSLGRASEYRLYSDVTIQAYNANKDQLIAPVDLNVTRTMSTGNGYDTGIDLELSRIYSRMDIELANLIQYRLRAIKLKPQQ